MRFFTGLSLILRFLFGLMSVALCLETHAFADSPAWTWSRLGGRRSAFTYSVTLGERFTFHYNRVRVVSTPPEALLSEIQLTAWYRRQIGFSVFYSQTTSGDSVRMLGAGIKLPFLAFASSPGNAIGGITLMLAADYVSYSYPPPANPAAYPDSGTAVRFGGSIHWNAGRTGLYLDTTMMVNMINNNFFLAPFVGIGFNF